MFNSARLKLTLWYLLIIFIISSVFSAVIYKMLTFEVDRFAAAHRVRYETKNAVLLKRMPPIDEDLVAESKRRIFWSLIYVNGVVLVGAGTFGYFLASKTLQPIKEMVEEQHRFISDASHELRTPLTALKSSIEVSLRDKNLTFEEAKNLLKENLMDTERLKKLTDSLLTLSSDKGNTAFEKLTIKKIISDAIDRVDPMSKNKEIKIFDKTQRHNVYGSRQNLTELITILLDNAIKYSPTRSEVVIKSKKIRGYVTITVSDSGIGIAKTDQTKIFDRFFRTEKARSEGGSGLGLAIAKKIITDHKGDIWVKSKPGKGSTFFVKLPTR